MSGWICYHGTAGQVHVLPHQDEVDHSPWPSCWCQPTRDVEDDNLWVHHSADGREADEEDAGAPATRH